MASIIDFPATLTPQAATVQDVRQSRSGGRSVSGAEQIVETDAGYWRMSLVFDIRRTTKIVLWRALRAKLRGRANILRCGPFDCARSAGRLELGPAHGVDALHSDLAPFSDETPYVSAMTDAVLSTAAVVRARTIVATVAGATARIEAGVYFSIADRLHIIEDAEVSGGSATITFWPPLRAAADAGTVVEFDHPRGLWRVADDETGQLALQALRMSSVQLDLVEASP